MKILLVEDFHLTRKMETEALREAGFHEIVEADDGTSAIEKLRKETDIGLIVSDWNMPKMNGYDFLVCVRSDERFRDLPFVMATAQGEKSQAVKALEAGADQLIVKPFTVQELKTVIEEVFSRREKRKLQAVKTQSPKKTAITVAHIQITDHLVLGVLNHLIAEKRLVPEHFDLKTLCMPSWNPVQKLLESGDADAAFILAPLAMDMFSFGIPVRLVLFSHKNGSICVKSRENEEDRKSLYDCLKSKIFFLPHTMSVHHVLTDMFLREIGLTLGSAGKPGADVFFEVVPPIRMADFLKQNPNACGFAVAEPFGTRAVSAGTSDLLFYSGELWENHPCCAVVFRQDFIREHADAVHEFVRMLAEAGQYISNFPEDSAQMALRFLDPDGRLGLNAPILSSVLTQPGGIRTDNLFPVHEDLDKMQRYMKEKMGIGRIIDVEKFTDIRFAEAAYRELSPSFAVSPQSSVIRSPERIVARIAGGKHPQPRSPSPSFPEKKIRGGADVCADRDRMLIRPSGDITAAEISEFRQLLKNLTEEGHTRFCFDFSKVSEIDSMGLGAFVVLSRMLSVRGVRHELEIIHAAPDIAYLFRMMRLDGMYKIRS